MALSPNVCLPLVSSFKDVSHIELGAHPSPVWPPFKFLITSIMIDLPHPWKLSSLGCPILWPGQHLSWLIGTFVVILAYVGEACSARKVWTQSLLLAFVIPLCNYLTIHPKPWTIGYYYIIIIIYYIIIILLFLAEGILDPELSVQRMKSLLGSQEGTGHSRQREECVQIPWDTHALRNRRASRPNGREECTGKEEPGQKYGGMGWISS